MHTPDSEGYIPFIHNYCDRRCERCRFVRQCRVGAVEVDDVGEDDDVVGDERVEDLHDRMKKLLGLSDEDMAAMEEVRKEHEDEPVDPLEEAREEAAMAEWQRQQEERDRQVDAQPLSVMGSTYLDLVRAWNRPREASFMARGVQLHPRMGMGIPVVQRTPEVLVLSEALQEVLWFHTMIHVKIQRALHGKLEADDEEDNALQSDWNGTAKVCIDGVDRSMIAWDTIVELLPEEADDALPIRELLRRMRQELDAVFPDAHAFIRPGFDAPGGG